MKVGRQLPFKSRVEAIPWGHPSLPAVALVLAPSPLPEAVEDYLARVSSARSRFGSLGARFEVVHGIEVDRPALVLTDGWAEVYEIWRGLPSTWPDDAELIEWLVYIGSQCPECGAVEDGWRSALELD